HPNCSRTLSKCQSFNIEHVALPTRCIEIESVQESTAPGSGLRFALRETAGRTGTYVALSHHWTEKAKIAQTKNSNYQCRTQKCEHISPCTTWISNPLTTLFKETCWLAMKLGIRYIWIDSICIVQDDTDDWAKESVRMAEYYQHAWLTIVATNTSESGNLRSDLGITDFPRITRLPYHDKDGYQQGHFYLQATGQSVLATDWQENVGNSTLLSRGWVLQEWLLSPRLLTFSNSSSGIFMQCRSNNTPKMVTGEALDTSLIRSDQIKASTIANAFKNILPFDMSSKKSLFKSWKSVVEAYSALDHSRVEKDRLVSLSGIAAEFGEALQKLLLDTSQISTDSTGTANKYVCGVWYDDIPSLLWERSESRPPRRLRGISAWSWASLGTTGVSQDGAETLVGAKVRWPDEHKTEELVCVVKQRVRLQVTTEIWQPLFNSPTDQSESGYGNDSRFAILRLRGRLHRVCIGSSFISEGDTNFAAELTGHSPDFGRSMWRRVTTYTKTDIVAGWASIEHPNYQTDVECLSDSSIFAFFVVKMPGIKRNFGIGRLSGKYTIFRVLYLRKVERPGYVPCYERVGVGRLFEREIESLFESAGAESIWLI
ncbi:HET-domain-containing protein, partial [Cucurbitaria berberidis CBS 394.84]